MGAALSGGGDELLGWLLPVGRVELRKIARHALLQLRTRRETSEHPLGTIKMRMGATHFLMKTRPKVATEMALCVLTYNLTRVLNIVGVPAVLDAIKG
jgi:hypothetical protein